MSGLVAAAGLLLAVGAAIAALHFGGVQQALFDRAVTAIEMRTGLRLGARSVRLEPFAARLNLTRPTLAAGAAEPFLTGDSLTVEVALGSLLRGSLVVREVVLVAPRLDGSRPLPDLTMPTGGATGESDGQLPVSVDRLLVIDGGAEGFALPLSLRPYLQALSLTGIALEGSLEDGQLDLSFEAARLRAAPTGQPALEVRIEGSLTGPAAGPLRLERLRLEGDALKISATGWLGLDAEQPLTAEIEIEADAPRLFGVEAAADPVRLVGELDLRTMNGDLRLNATALPGELAGPWLEAELWERSALPGSRFRIDGVLTLRQGGLSGAGEARWIRDGVVVAEATATSPGGDAAELPVDVQLLLLPGTPGDRSLELRLLLPREDPLEGRIERGRLSLSLPDLEPELTRLRALWPAWVPALPAGLAAGPLRIDGRLTGRLQDPAMRLDGEWMPAPGASLRLAANASLAARHLEARMTLASLPLARFSDDASGALAGSAELTLSGDRLAGQLSVGGEGLRLQDIKLGRARLTASLDGRRVLVHELIAEEAGRSLRASGAIELDGVPVADLGFELAGRWGPVSAVEGSLRLAEGRLLVDVPRAVLVDVPASFSAVAPLATLARLPGAERLAELSLEGGGGPLEIEWVQPAIDWAAALGGGQTAGEEPPPLWVAGTRGRLALDPSLPAIAVGEIVISDLELEQGGHALRSPAPLGLTLSAGLLTLQPAEVDVDGYRVEISGEARLRPDWLPGQLPAEFVEEARVVAHTLAAAPVEDVDLDVLLRDGNLELTVAALLDDGGRGRLEAAAPLAALFGGDEGVVELRWELPPADWSLWFGDAVDEDRVLTRLVAGTTGSLRLEPGRPALASGELRIPRFEVDVGDQRLRAQAPIVLRLAGGRLDVESARLSASGAPLELAGWVDLEPDWRFDVPAAQLVHELALTGTGVLPAAFLNPFLAGGTAEGTLLVELEIAGLRDTARGELRLSGPGAGFYFVAPYAFEVAAPELVVRVDGGEAAFEGGARLNEGRLSFSGEGDGEKGIAGRAQLKGVRALLDHGLLTVLDGDLRLTVAPDGTGLLGGRVIVDQGQLTRSLRLDSLLLDQLLPADLLGTELDPLEAIALDLTLETRQGVRVKNNLADLKVRWEPVKVRGNLLQPTIEGRLEADPGGLVFAYGQTVRLDAAAVIYRGLPQEAPTLELQTTTSFEDPSIGRLAGNDPFAEERLERDADDDKGPGAAAAGEVLTTGLASFLGEQFNSSVGELLGGTRIGFRPLLIFGEADPGARLTASSDLSGRATVAASVDLRNAERQTYLLDLHDEQAAARLAAQLFTNDRGNQGGTLQQRLEFGGVRRRAEGPRLRRLTVDRLPGVRRRALKRAAGYRKGERLDQGASFEIAVAVGELLRNRGYPDARVRVEEEPAPHRSGVVLAVRVDSGSRVDFQFTGEELPRSLRRAVAQLYRGDFYEPQAIEEMRLEAVRAWRSRGYLDPRVTIQRELLPGPPERRRVIVESRPGERVALESPRFPALPASDAAELAALFASTLRRVELAAGLEAAERRVLQGLAALGYPEAVITGCRLSPDRRQLTVDVELGEQLRVAALEFADASGLRTEIGEAGGVEAGEPVRADRLSRAAFQVESQLRDAGYLDAEVTLRLESLGSEEPAERKAVFELDRGSIYRLAATEFRGLGATRSNWARRTAALAEGEPLAPTELRDARRRLYGTGLFSAVGSAVSGEQEGGARVLFEVEERPRFRLAYGLRWESEEGTSLVVDLLDRNVWGRGIDLGLRTLWSDEVRQLRLSGSIPGVLGPKSHLELFALAGEEERLVEDGEILDETRSVEGTVQLGWQLGPRTTGRIYGRYRDVRFTETFLVEDPFFGPLDPIEVRVQQPFLGLQYIFDGRDDRAAPARGLFASLDLSYSDESLGGDIRYGRLFGQLHSFRPAGRLVGRRLTWAQSVRLGRAEAFSGQELLGDLLLRAGGEYSVRGYRRESLGPPALTGTVLPSIQDNSIFVLNEELRFELWDLFSGLIFLDTGNVWIEDDIDFDLFTSLGLGLRADTPLGLLRLDVAFPLDRRQDIDPDVKLYFGLGNVF